MSFPFDMVMVCARVVMAWVLVFRRPRADTISWERILAVYFPFRFFAYSISC